MHQCTKQSHYKHRATLYKSHRHKPVTVKLFLLNFRIFNSNYSPSLDNTYRFFLHLFSDNFRKFTKPETNIEREKGILFSLLLRACC